MRLAWRKAPSGSRADLIRRARQALPACRFRWQQAPDGEALVITDDPEIMVIWIPGRGLWSLATPHHDRIVAALIGAFGPDLVGTINRVASGDEMARPRVEHETVEQCAGPAPGSQDP